MNKSSQKQAKILGVRIDGTSVPSVLRKVRSDIKKRKKFYIVTPNPEHVLLAQEDREFSRILNKADISICDGIGLVAAHKFLKLPNPKDLPFRVLTLFAQGLGVGFSVLFNRSWLEKDLKVIKGRDLFLDLVALSNKKGWRVYLLGGEKGEAEGAKKQLEKIYKGVKIKAYGGPMLNSDGLPIAKIDSEKEAKAVSEINKFKPHFLFVAASFPRQEKWLYRWYKKLNIGGSMVVGGTFNYIAGRKKLPPKWVDDRGLEWVWRLLSGNQKAKRIFSAFPTFPVKIFWDKFTQLE